MKPPALRLVEPVSAPPVQSRPLGELLVARRIVPADTLAKAIALSARTGATLASTLIARGWADEDTILSLWAEAWQAPLVPAAFLRPDAERTAQIGAETCLWLGIVPIRDNVPGTTLATSDPEAFAQGLSRLPAEMGPYRMVLAPRRSIEAAIAATAAPALAERAETLAPGADSARSLDLPHLVGTVLTGLAALVGFAIVVPKAAFAGLVALAVACLVSMTLLKTSAAVASIRPARPRPAQPLSHLPIVTVLVALYREEGIVERLLTNLGRIDYPPECLDILLVAEADDTRTLETLRRADLLPTIRILSVPAGTIRTKPRALNYALPFARGSIIGVYDAEDAPEPDQVLRAVRHFAAGPSDLACVQASLDFYAPRTNWLTRCFTLDYAGWFRVTLPGLARLGFVVPLGGTSLFFKRKALEAVGGWDAHSVTEDADLGLRLARSGYQTELLPSVTREEPNARVTAWIRQRARWQKGYFLTWVVAMRAPVALFRELGPWRFAGVQVLMLGSLVQALLAPVLWGFWALALGLAVAGPSDLPGWVAPLSFVSVMAALADLLTAALGAFRAGHRPLVPWLPVLWVYGMLGTFSAYRAAWETLRRPFHWDKTAHGLIAEETPAPVQTVILPAPAPRPLASRERMVLSAIAQDRSRQGPRRATSRPGL